MLLLLGKAVSEGREKQEQVNPASLASDFSQRDRPSGVSHTCAIGTKAANISTPRKKPRQKLISKGETQLNQNLN